MMQQEFQTALRPWLDRQPFVPFAFVLTAGGRREVHSRSAIRYMDGAAAYLSTPDDPFGEPVRGADVARLEPLPQREVTVMTPDEFFNELRRQCDRTPYRPFTVELTSGERVEVDDPEGLAFAGGFATFIPEEGDLVEFAHSDVARIITAEPAPSP
jgi:hypothetical protein